MRVPGWKSLRQGARWVRSRFDKGALVLGYHRIADKSNDVFSLGVSPQHFAQQLQVLHKHAHPVTLETMIQCLREGNLPPRAVVITFDDGYEDNLFQARPLLQHYEIPATFFIASGYLGEHFWWDELAWRILNSESFPGTLSLFDDGHSIVRSSSDEDRLKLLNAVYHRLLDMDAADCREAMAQLIQEISVPAGQKMNFSRALTPEELIELAKGELVDIGAHTVNHPVLTNLSEESQRYEIEQCKEDLETILQRPVTTFSYPNGASNDVTQALTRQAGFLCACNSYSDVARPGDDVFNLPRFWVPDLDGRKFTHWLTRWL